MASKKNFTPPKGGIMGLLSEDTISSVDNPQPNTQTETSTGGGAAAAPQEVVEQTPKKKRAPRKKKATPAPLPDTIPEGYKLDPRLVEKRSRRLQLLLQPSLHEKVKARAAKEKMSVNDFIHKTLETATREEK